MRRVNHQQVLFPGASEVRVSNQQKDRVLVEIMYKCINSNSQVQVKLVHYDYKGHVILYTNLLR